MNKYLLGLVLAGVTVFNSHASELANAQKELQREQKISVLEEKVSEANQKLREFPDKISGAGNVEKYKVPGAEYCLAQIKQVHFHEPTGIDSDDPLIREQAKKLWKEQYEHTNDIQKNIASILYHLKGKGYEEVRAEGFRTDLTKQDINKEYCLRLNLAGYILDIGELNVKNIKKLAFISGGDLFAGKYYGIKILPAEKAELHDKAILNPTNKDIVNDARENALLKIISNYNEPLSITTYGANHNFKDNIEAWNINNPDKKFSLIVITPKSLYREKN